MSDTPDGPLGEILLYDLEDGRARVECRFANETLSLSQALIGTLFQKDVRTLNEHLTNIYQEGELGPEATIGKFRIVQLEGTRRVARTIDHYNLEAILAVGYETEIGELNRIVVMWLDFAEDQAIRRKQVFLKDWEKRLDDFLRFNGRAVFPGAGRVSHADAIGHARAEYDLFAAQRRVLLEAQGVREADDALEQAAKRLPARGSKQGKSA